MPALAAALVVACINATMADDVAIRKLREAEAALDDGDVETARALARDVRAAARRDEAVGLPATPLGERATRLHALSFVRDRAAEHDELLSATSSLAAAYELAEDRERGGGATPQLAADYGEALERVRDDERAYDVLVPLADRDLIGSAYANAALARVAERRGDRVRTDLGRARCLAAAQRAAMCRGEYPPRPFFRGRPLDYALPGLVVLAFAVARRARRRVWSAHAAAPLSGAISVGGWAVFLLANARLGALAGAAALALPLALAVVQRRLFVRAAEGGAVPGLILRPPEPGDEHAPLLRLFFGPPEPKTLEPTGDAGYRESARRPILRIARRTMPGPAVMLLAVFVLILAGIVAGAVTLTLGA